MKDRKNALLSAIINEHIETGNTVASKTIVDNHDFKLSPATIRNEMVCLEKEGYIYQPHTSAGRIPTEKGWKLFIDNF
ncbi:heat-inducible transcriptional repressor HrcA, partial [Patescibacteria group bacterium]|nr:heat-inducible transcriptional repressor HrcA [Patescibacteria group bacterium]